MKLIGKVVSVDEVVREVEKDLLYFDSSGGGVTFSGGEPLSQPRLLREALVRLKRIHVHTAVDTSGYAPREVLASIMPHVDLFLYDIKIFDSREHERYTGCSNDLIKENLKFIVRSGKQVIIRFPIIPGITDTEENVAKWADFLSKLKKINEVDLLPYHDVKEKFQRLNIEYKMKTHDAPSQDTIKWVKSVFENLGFNVKIGG